uniref:Uncharacterized protein n=1 Tax=viral metagenome TaxID=1070528 RepID=A0A6M3LRC8_9ZZZZ
MAWTKYDCCVCMTRVIKRVYVDAHEARYEPIGKCDGSCKTGKQTTWERVDNESDT